MRQGAPSAAQPTADRCTAGAARQPTHLLVGDEALEPANLLLLQHQRQQQPGQPGQGQQRQHLVHFSWLTGCLEKRRRLGEADFHPAALAAAAAAYSDNEDPEFMHNQQQGAAAASPPVAAVAAAATASAAAASSRPPPLRQLAVRSPMLTSADVQQLVLHLLADAPRPHWLSVHVSRLCGAHSRTCIGSSSPDGRHLSCLRAQLCLLPMPPATLLCSPWPEVLARRLSRTHRRV